MSFTFLRKIERIIIYYTMVYYTSFHSGDKTGTNIIRYIGRRAHVLYKWLQYIITCLEQETIKK